MASHHDIPLPTAMLCEHCGYNLTGLAAEGRCPECGRPIADSVGPGSRGPTPWEAHPGLQSWFYTRYQMLWHPSLAARRMLARQGQERSRWFACIELTLASAWFTLTVFLHARWLGRSGAGRLPLLLEGSYRPLRFLAVMLAFLLLLWGLLWITARLTAWEAAYRGLRLPRLAAERGLHYHSVHETAAAMASALLVLVLTRWVPMTPSGDLVYVYSLCAFVVAAAVYLFLSYWAIMRKLLHANF